VVGSSTSDDGSESAERNTDLKPAAPCGSLAAAAAVVDQPASSGAHAVLAPTKQMSTCQSIWPVLVLGVSEMRLNELCDTAWRRAMLKPSA
jgi:hypothetical protein